MAIFGVVQTMKFGQYLVAIYPTATEAHEYAHTCATQEAELDRQGREAAHAEERHYYEPEWTDQWTVRLLPFGPLDRPIGHCE